MTSENAKLPPTSSGPLSAERQALFERLLEKKGLARAQQAPSIQRRPEGGPCPASFMQQRLWFLEQLTPGGSAYNLPAALRISGRLDVSALQRSLDELLRRHEILRTTFRVEAGQVMQGWTPAAPLDLPRASLTDVPASEREGALRRLLATEVRRPFDLSRGPLVRTLLVKLDEDTHVLLLTAHHTVFDGWSGQVFVNEFAALYGAFVAGRSSPLPEPQIQYADYSTWQRSRLEGGLLEQQLGYWKRQLAGLVPLELPGDEPASGPRDTTGVMATLTLPAARLQALKELSQREGASLFMTLLATFQVLLSRLAGAEDITVGSPIAGRERREAEQLIGPLLNTLVLRTQLTEPTSFRELLRQVRATCLDAYANQDVPFERLVEALQPERDLHRHPLFEVMFNLVNTPSAVLELPGLTLRPLELEEPEAKLPLTLYAEERSEGLHLWAIAQRSRFPAERLERMLTQYAHLLEQVVAAPDTRLDALSLVTPRERPLLPDPTQLLDEPPMPTVTAEFLDWAQRLPEHPALMQGARRMTYRELAEAAQAIASALLSSGLAPGEVVAISAPRSFGLIASMWGVLLGGGALLTLDRQLPAERQRLMLTLARVRRLIHVGPLRPEEAWLKESSLELFEVSSNDGACSRATAPAPGLLPALAPDAPAYVFFTSGTTGTPKGVLGRHRGLSHFLTWQRDTFFVGPMDRCAQLTGLSFDVVLRDIFLPLISGATLCLPEEGMDPGPARMTAWLEEQGVSLLHIVPAVAGSWLAHFTPPAPLRALRLTFFAGEPLPAALVSRWRQVFPSAEVINLYGPTETTLAKCFFRVPAEPVPGTQPVGTPLPQTQALVLTRGRQLCGIGEPGEIVLRTPFRSLGYIGASEEEQRRFAPNPFREDPRDTVYFTGDRGCYRADGSLAILGRLDHQVKIRGMRVEPREVEIALGAHASVRQCVVVAREDGPGGKRLVAYAVTDPAQPVKAEELATFLGTRLPAYMVPQAFVLLAALPVTPNGKVDRRALPEPERPQARAQHVPPQSELERAIATAWQQVLQREQVGVDENFFDLGGHSLLLLQLQARLREVLQRDVPIVELFRFPTVGALANHLGQAQPAAPTFDEAKSRAELRKAASRRQLQRRATHRAGRSEGEEDE
jgi:amino acid adenylation domain-containing protein